MTRLNAGKMNKDYIDAEQLERCLLNRADTTEAVRSGSFSLEVIKDVLNNQDVNKMKSFLRAKELPVVHEARAHLWMLISCGTTDLVAEDETYAMYATKFNCVSSEKILPIHDMSEDIRVHHMLSTEGVKACHRVLYVISETHPHILQFSPLLYAFTSVMLHYMNEQSCFHCICDLLKRKDINYFLVPGELSLHAASYVLRDLAFKHARTAAVSIERGCPDGDLVGFCNDWVLWIFKHLPFQYLVRIIDCYLVEGYKVLFRVALVVIKLFHKISIQKSSFVDSGKPDAGIKAMCSQIESYASCDRLLKEAFGIRGFSKKEIDSLFLKTEMALRRGVIVSVRSPRPSESEPTDKQSNKRPHLSKDNKRKLASHRSQKSFKLDKDVHTQLVLEDVDSDILDKQQQLKLWSWLPPAEAVRDAEIVFTTNEDGYSLKTFYEKVERMGPVLIIVRTMDSQVFGAYCSADWVERHKHFDTGAQISYFGTGQSFVFSVAPQLAVYNWVGRDHPVTPQSHSMFQAGDRSMLMVGGGNGCALQIDKDLDHGSTAHCDTFNNDPLVESGQFRIQSLEAFAFH